MYKNKKIISFLLLCSFFTSTNSQAAEMLQTDENIEEKSLEELLNIDVVTVSKTAQKSSVAPATIYVITEEKIKSRGYRNLRQLLADIPELEIQEKAVTETRDIFSVRGIAGNEKFIIMQDGFKVNAGDGTPHVIGDNYPLLYAKRVEVILGPSSALYGVDAFGGIINIITKTGEEVNGASINGSYGTYNTTNNSFMVGKKVDNVSFLVSGHGFYSSEPNFSQLYPNEYKWYNDQYSKNGNMQLSPFAPNVILNTSPIKPYDTPTLAYALNAKLNFDNFEFNYFRNSESHNSSVGLKPEFNIYQADAIYKVNIESISGRHSYTSTDKKWGLVTSISKNAFEIAPDSKFVNTFTNYKDGYKYATSTRVLVEEQANYSINDYVSLIGGISYEDINSLPKTGDLPFPYKPNIGTDLQNIPYIGTNVKDKNGKDLTVQQDFYNLHFQNVGTYLQAQSTPLENLNLTLGARYDYNTRYGASINPRAGLVYNPIKPFTMKLLYGEAFLAPTPYKAYQHYGSFIPQTNPDTKEVDGLFGPFWHLPNPDLRPEKLRTLEGSLAYYFTENFHLSLNGYYNNISDLIVVEVKPKDTFKGIPIDAAEKPINKGTSNTYGGTLRAESLFNFGDFSLNPYAAYSLSLGDIAGQTLPFSAMHTVKSGIDFNYKNFSLSPRLIFRSSSYHPTLKDSKGNSLSNDPFLVVNVFARYNNIFNSDKFKTSLFLEANNLLNAKYYNVSLANAEGFGSSPQDPLRVLGGVNIEL